MFGVPGLVIVVWFCLMVVMGVLMVVVVLDLLRCFRVVLFVATVVSVVCLVLWCFRVVWCWGGLVYLNCLD